MTEPTPAGSAVGGDAVESDVVRDDAAGRVLPDDGPAWVRVRAATWGALAGLAMLLVGAWAGRADVAVIGAPVVVWAVWCWTARPSGDVVVEVETDASTTPGELRTAVRVSAPAGTTAVALGLRRSNRTQARALVRVRDGRREVPFVVHTVRTGPQTVAEVDSLGLGPGLASVSEPGEPAAGEALVLPGVRPLGALPLPPRLRGLTGGHDSRRPGEGGGLRDVHPYTPGDRLRRIDWRVTARRSPRLRELYVRREHALAEAVVVLVVDSRDEVGPDPRTWGGWSRPRGVDPTSLDLARTAAASLAQAFLDQGDRVGLDDLGALRRPLPPGGGRRQLDRIRNALALTRPEGDPVRRTRAPQLPSGALVVVFSTFLDDQAAHAAAQWRAAGHRVVAVDVLPTLREHLLDARERLALQLVTIARADRLAALADADVELVSWRDHPEVALAGLARRAQRRAGAGAR